MIRRIRGAWAMRKLPSRAEALPYLLGRTQLAEWGIEIILKKPRGR